MEAPLKIIDKYKSRTSHIYDIDDLFENHNETSLVEFEYWFYTFKSSTIRKILSITSPEAGPKSSGQATISAALKASAAHRFGTIWDTAAFRQISDFGDIGISYLLCTKVNGDDWSKLIELKVRYQQTLLSIFEQAGKYVEVPQTILDSPLPFPVMLMNEWSLEKTKTFIQAGWTVDCLGRSLLHILLETVPTWNNGWHSRFIIILDSLPELVHSRDIFGRTALYVASEYGHYKAMVSLLSRGADATQGTHQYLTPLHVAAASGKTSICNLLLHRPGVDLNLEAVRETTPLNFAARHGHNDVVQLLVDHDDVDVNHRDGDGHTPFHLAVIGQHLGILKILRSHKEAEVEICDVYDRIVLLDAVDDGFVEGFRYLLEDCGMDPNCRMEEEEYTPLMLAAERGIIEIVEMLVKNRRTWLLPYNEDGEDASDLASDSTIKGILRSAWEDRWGQDIDVMVEKVMMWPRIRDMVAVYREEELSKCLAHLDSFNIQYLAHFFEKCGLCGWIDISAKDWNDAQVKFENKIAAYINDYGLEV
jgi:ankyrin repeat protein